MIKGHTREGAGEGNERGESANTVSLVSRLTLPRSHSHPALLSLRVKTHDRKLRRTSFCFCLVFYWYYIV